MKTDQPLRTPTHDDLIKALLSQPRLLAEFFRAFVPETAEFADFSDIEYLDKEHPASRKRPRRAGDLLVKARWRSRETGFLIHFESQSRPQAASLERIGEYSLRDAIRYRMPVMPVLLLTYPKPASPQPKSLHWKFGKAAAIQVKCPVIHFCRIDPLPHLGGGNVAALALTSLMPLDGEQQVEAIALTLAEALRQQFSDEEIAAAMAFVKHYTPLNEGQLLQLERRVGMLSEKEKALVAMPKLINPFVELGKLKGRTDLATRQLRKKFPRIAKQAEPLVGALDEETLMAFGEALLFFETEAECLDWLKKR